MCVIGDGGFFGREILDIKPIFGEHFLTQLQKALSMFDCFIPAIANLPNPPKGTVYKKFYHIDKCTFVPKAVAESKKCGGLQLFQNVPQITEDSHFCEKSLGKKLSL